jgi:hypothetical protein
MSNEKIPLHTRVFFQERLKLRLFNMIVQLLLDKQKEDPSFTKKVLAKRIDRTPAQVTRWLSSPGNWTIDTISDLLLAIDTSELEFTAQRLPPQKQTNTAPHRAAYKSIQATPAQPSINVNPTRTNTIIVVTHKPEIEAVYSA